MKEWNPPKSPFDLVQEHLYEDPWRVLVACIFCNLTRRKTAEPIMWNFFNKYPTPVKASSACEESLKRLLLPLGLSSKRAKTLKRMSKEYLEKDWKEPIELYGLGKYANDAWKIFCTPKWKSAEPKDHALVWYHEWLLENHS